MAARDGEGITPLYFAYQKSVIRIIDYLIKKGASKDTKTKYSISPEILHPLSAYSKSIELLSQ
jgi:hypothetical protein